MLIVYPQEDYVALTGELYQWDYGQRIKISGVTLPESYIVHYSHKDTGYAISVTGDSTGANVPDELLESGEDIFCWVFVQDGETGTTEYRFKINVNKKPKPTEPRPDMPSIETVVATYNFSSPLTINAHDESFITAVASSPVDAVRSSAGGIVCQPAIKASTGVPGGIEIYMGAIPITCIAGEVRLEIELVNLSDEDIVIPEGAKIMSAFSYFKRG